MSRVFRLLVITLALLAPAAKALAWGSEGHRIVAALAYERLTPKARGVVDELLKHSAEQDTPSCAVATLMDAAIWPDCVRPIHARFDYLAVMHYEDVPICGPIIKAVDCPNGACITSETERALAILKDAHRSAVDRLQALEEVAHFVGDLHQPLHAADNNDRGGNSVHVTIAGRETNLHHVWDVDVLENALGTSESAAEATLRPIVSEHAMDWSSGDLEAWLGESHALALGYVYPKLPTPPVCGEPSPDQTIDQTYLDGAAPIVREQLAKAAVRLAKLLNAALA